ncbi:hypothetical protein ACWEU6_26420 [Streptosporangium sandarakinum]|uniref:hypothetical protein n=1 Tax=Streptosporangium sandarakinum TaxID=1260955 RepID=UPI0036A66BA4
MDIPAYRIPGDTPVEGTFGEQPGDGLLDRVLDVLGGVVLCLLELVQPGFGDGGRVALAVRLAQSLVLPGDRMAKVSVTAVTAGAVTAAPSSAGAAVPLWWR